MIDIVIPHYGPDSLLDNCTSSISSGVVGRIEVVNNNFDNLGFSAGVNEGLRKLRDSKYIAIVNNDTRFASPLDAGAFVKLHEFMEKHPEVGIVSPKIVKEEHEDLIVHGGTAQCFPNGVHKTGLVSLGQLDTWTYEKWLSFAVVVIRMDALIDVGLLDENMFLIFSDSDWCYRARYAGWKCAYCPDETWTHRMGESANPTSSESYNIMRKDSLIFFKKWVDSAGLFTELDREILT